MSLVSIGEFAQASRLSPKALRLYDELGLLVPARVDPVTGYRWYTLDQLPPARQVSILRRIGMPLARIRQLLALPPEAAAEEVLAHWSATEAEHVARGELARLLVNELLEKRSVMYEVKIRQVPERQVLSLIRRMHQDELVTKSRELFIFPLREAPRIEGVDGAPYMIFHGEISADSDGPIEWCRPVPDDRAEEAAAQFPPYELRTEPAHEEAFIQQDAPGMWASDAHAELAMQTLLSWATEHHRQPLGSGAVRMVLVHNPANGNRGPDTQFAVALR